MQSTREIVDEEALEEYNDLRDHPVLNEYRKYQTSNTHLEVDVAASLYQLRKKCKKFNLPEEELRYVETRHQLFVIFNNQATALKKRALGITGSRSVPDRERILDARKAELIELFGKYYSAQEVHEIVNQDWGIECSIAAVKDFRGKHIEQIKERQEEYRRDFSNVRLGHKRSRLDELTYLYSETKQRYKETRERSEMKFMRDLLESIKKEVEGDVVTIQGDIKATIEHTLDAHINQEVFPQLSINEIIISRVAGRLGVNPLFLLWKLQNSMYSEFTGFDSRESFDPYEEEPIYPSSMVYDLDKLQKRNKEAEVEEAEVIEEIEGERGLDEEERKKAEEAKRILRERMREKNEEFDQAQNRIDAAGGKDPDS